MNNDFYKLFEDTHRGTREYIKKRQKIYLPFIDVVHSIYPDSMVLDIGCGRGEWLELLKEHQINAVGIDIDQDMIKETKSHNLQAILTDAISYLKQQKDNSLIAISAFHVIEHIPFDDLQILLQESLRVLKPGGLLILETPNPENLKVATEYFHMDPTHNKPIPLHLLDFTIKYYGFEHTKILRLQENKQLINSKSTIYQILEGVSPDYAIIAQNNIPQKISSDMHKLYEKEYGVSLNDLVKKYDNNTQNTIFQIESLKTQILNFENQLTQINQYTKELEHNYYLLLNSNSWKITYPLRISKQYLIHLIQKIKKLVLYIFKYGIIFIKNNHYLYNIAQKILNKFPKIKLFLKTQLLKQNQSTNTNKTTLPSVPNTYYTIDKILERLKK